MNYENKIESLWYYCKHYLVTCKRKPTETVKQNYSIYKLLNTDSYNCNINYYAHRDQ
jgi:hypothetical protein